MAVQGAASGMSSGGGSSGAPAPSGGGGHFSGNSHRDGGSQGSSVDRGGAGGENVLAFQRELQETQGSMRKLMEDFGKERDTAKSDRETLQRLRQALAPEGEGQGKGQKDPTAKWEQQLDYYLAEAVEAEKRGQGIPLTTNLAVELFNGKIEAYRREQELMATVKELKEQMQQARDPQQTINHTAYAQIDNSIQRGLDQLYGPGDEYLDQKSAMFDAIAGQVSRLIQATAKDDFKQWDRLRRSPQQLQRLVNEVIKQNIPPQARKILEEDHIKNTPMPMSELRQAFKEAGSIEDAQERTRIQKMIREEILDNMYSSGKLRVRE